MSETNIESLDAAVAGRIATFLDATTVHMGPLTGCVIRVRREGSRVFLMAVDPDGNVRRFRADVVEDVDTESRFGGKG